MPLRAGVHSPPPGHLCSVGGHLGRMGGAPGRQHREGLPDPTPPHAHQSRPWQPTTFPAKMDMLDGVLDSRGGGRSRAPRGVGSQTSGHANSLHRSSFPQSPGVGAGRPAVGVGGLPGEAQDSQQATGCQPGRGPSCARRGRLPRWTLLRLARGPVDPGWTVP